MKHLKKHRPGRAKALLLIASLAVLLTATVGSTAAWLVSKPAAVENNFVPGKVACEVQEKFGADYVKRDVSVQNTGNTDAYIRVLLVFTWKDKDGNIFSNKPQEGKDYQINMDNMYLTDWIMQKSDTGVYFYYKKRVAPEEETGKLIESLYQIATVTGPENGKYKLSVDILADAVQANPPQAVKDSWGVDVENDEIKIKTQGGVSNE